MKRIIAGTLATLLLIGGTTGIGQQETAPKATVKAAVSDHVKIIGDNNFPIGGLCILTVDGLLAKDSLSWVAVPEIPIADFLDRAGRPVLLVPTNTAGTYHLVLAFTDDGKVAQKVHKVIVGPVVPPGPVPPTPIPPGPTPPGPTPPGPTPPGPIPPSPSGLRVFILEETAARAKLPAGQVTALMSEKARAYITTHAAKVGNTPEYRQWDDDVVGEQLKYASEDWRKVYDRAKTDSKGVLPWCVITNGQTGVSQPFPKTEAEWLTLLKQYGGN